MKTKEQKSEQIKQAEQLLLKSRFLVFADFSGLKVEGFQRLKKSLKAPGNILRIVKKRLLKIALQKFGADFDPVQFESQVATLFSGSDLHEIAAPIYKFSKDVKDAFKILGAYDILNKKFISSEEVKFLGQLPSREVLLGRTVGMISVPLKMFLFILQGRVNKLKP
ncbi:MAG: 50S ribosomal protein L10 [Patescibacteria group bacterium]